MKRSASKAELSSEPLGAVSDAMEPTQAGLGLEPHRVRGQRNVGEGSVQSTIESCSFLDVERGAIQANSGVSVQPTGLGLELHSFQEQPDVEEVAIQANSGVGVQSTQAGFRLESCTLQEQPNVEEGAIQPNCQGAVQPMQAGLELESRSSQEQPNVENREGVVVHPTQAALLSSSPRVMISIENCCKILRFLEEQGIFNGFDLELPALEVYNFDEIIDAFLRQGNRRNHQVEASHQEEEADINDIIVPQNPPSDMNNLRNDQVETSHQEEEAGVNDRVVPQAPPFDMNNLRNDGWIELEDLDEPTHDEEDIGIQARAARQQIQSRPPQQGTAGRRMRLQVSLCGAEGPNELKIVSIATSERTGVCGGLRLVEQEVEFLAMEPTNLLSEDATCSSASVTMQKEGDTKGPLCAEGSIACVTKSDHTDVAQQTLQDVSGSSSTFLVHLFLELPGDACILPAFAAELSNKVDDSEDGFNGSVVCCEAQLEGRQSMVCHLNSRQGMTPSSFIEKAEMIFTRAVSSGECRKQCMGHGSCLTHCLFWMAMLALIFLCSFRSFCRWTRTAFTYF